ncbi:MAG: efflux RND transporter permease subunit [Bryobacteraceae bacterium]
MHKLAALCVRRPVFATMLIMSLVVVGVFSYLSLGVDLLPKVDVPTVVITTVNPGATAEEIETEITKRIEDAVNTISEIDEVRSTSVQGLSSVMVAFTLDKNGDIAAQEIRDKVSQTLPDLPDTAEAPVVVKRDPDADPILQLVISGSRSIREITEIADKEIKPRLENVKGVGEIQLVGGLRREIRVWVDPDRMRAYGLSVADVATALRQQNVEMPAGSVTEGANELTVRTLGRLVDAEQFNEIAVVSRGPYVVKLRDIGHAEDAVEEPTTAARLNGSPSVTLVISKQSGTNTVATAQEVKFRIAELQASMKDIKFEIIKDQSVFIELAVEAIQSHLIEGSFLASVIIFFFLANIRTTLIAAVAIPTSIIATFALMKAMDFTLNQITMLALTLMVGVVIDDAIIVLENIYRYIEEKGMAPMEAAVEATKEIGLAVMATTLSLLAVFLPIGFMGGIVGRFMSSFGFTAGFAVAISLIVSFTLTPMLSSRFLKAPVQKDGVKHDSKESRFFKPIDRSYTFLLKWAMAHRKTMVTICALVVVSIVPLFMVVGKSFTPVDDKGEFNVDITAPEGTSLAATTTIAERVARDLRADPNVVATLTTVGAGTERQQNSANIYVKLTDFGSPRKEAQEVYIVKARDVLKNYPSNLRTRVGAGNWSGNADLQYTLSGPDLAKLGEYSQALLAKVKQIPNVVDADTSLVYGKPELRVEIDRQRAADLGVRVGDIAQALNTLLAGQVVSTFPSAGELYDVRLRADIQYRNKREALNQLTVASAKSGPVSLDQVVRIKEGEAPSSINRLNRQRQVTISANLMPGGSQGDVTSEIARIAATDIKMDAGYSSGAAGQTRELARTATYFLTAVALTGIFMYIVLAAQFESFLHPFTILLTLPLSIPFGILSLWMFGQTVNVFSGLGLLLLFGIVKKNAILQIDHTNGLREKGMNMYDAIIMANRDRLRPILMTTMALVAGMLPVVLSTKAGVASNRAIGILVVGGQSMCLLLTLLAVPVFYSLFEDAKESRFMLALNRKLSFLGNRLQPATTILQRNTEEV